MSTAETWREDAVAKLVHTRARTIAIIEPLTAAVLSEQVRDFMSPLIWDLGHMADFERLWLVDNVAGDAEDGLESKYDALETPRAERADLDLPSKFDVLGEMEDVRRRVLEVLDAVDVAGGNPLLQEGYLYRMVIQHEGQHQETMLQALDIPGEAGWGHPEIAGGGDDGPDDAVAAVARIDAPKIDDTERVFVPAGIFRLGTGDRSRAYDNERPVHEAPVGGFEIDRYPATNRRWAAFIDDGGYLREELWSAAGRDWLRESECRCPQGWLEQSAGWSVQRFGRVVDLDLGEPAQHVCYWEAEAFARWSGGRLPTEMEWEKAAAWGPGAETPRTYPWGESGPSTAGLLPPASGQPGALMLVDGSPPSVGSHPHLASRYGVEDMLGQVYEWTSSPFAGYPGFEAFPYREYSEVFFGDEYRVLRGASWAAHPMLWRNTYRNWDLRERRQIFAGVRVAYGDD